MSSYSLVTITFNPAVDKSTAVASLIPEKKLVCSNPILEPGGGGINVARAVKKLGGEALAVFPAGGYNGRLLERLLEREGVASLAIPIKNDSRENLVVLDKGANLQYRFGMPGPEMTLAEWTACLQAIEDVSNPRYIVASGSLGNGVPSDIFAQLAVIAKKKNAKLVVDTSGEPLKAAVGEGVYMIKPNLGELACLAGREELDFESVTGVARQIIDNGGCEMVVVSMGAGGAMLV
ncbi:MAG TPA: PfkB family carbohydrate kinase, partial [Chitinophagaceae bacterium]|nr:PfkB family carbohydrate kinase [Chitinophagaceae bacterium]